MDKMNGYLSDDFDANKHACIFYYVNLITLINFREHEVSVTHDDVQRVMGNGKDMQFQVSMHDFVIENLPYIDYLMNCDVLRVMFATGKITCKFR